MKVLLLYAFPREVKEFLPAARRSGETSGLPFRAFRIAHPKHQLLAAETGLGIENAVRVLRRMVESDMPDGVVSLGYCGALSTDAAVGDLIWASQACLVGGQETEMLSLPDNRRLLDRLALTLPIRPGTFVTMKEWMKKSEVASLITRRMILPVCDMETYGVAHLCLRLGLPFCGIRAASDSVDLEVAFDPRDVCDRDGFYSSARAIRLLLGRPRLITHMMKLRRNSDIASRNLAGTIRTLIDLL